MIWKLASIFVKAVDTENDTSSCVSHGREPAVDEDSEEGKNTRSSAVKKRPRVGRYAGYRSMSYLDATVLCIPGTPIFRYSRFELNKKLGKKDTQAMGWKQ
jgi:hypothetical protein